MQQVGGLFTVISCSVYGSFCMVRFVFIVFSLGFLIIKFFIAVCVFSLNISKMFFNSRYDVLSRYIAQSEMKKDYSLKFI